jgi:hypothetical protein
MTASIEKRSKQNQEPVQPYRVSVRKVWQDFASIFKKDPYGEYIYDPDKLIDVE